MVKKVNCPCDLFVGWYGQIGDSVWIFLGRTHKLFFGNHLFRFLVVNRLSGDVRSEFLSQSGVIDYVLSKMH